MAPGGRGRHTRALAGAGDLAGRVGEATVARGPVVARGCEPGRARSQEEPCDPGRGRTTSSCTRSPRSDLLLGITSDLDPPPPTPRKPWAQRAMKDPVDSVKEQAADEAYARALVRPLAPPIPAPLKRAPPDVHTTTYQTVKDAWMRWRIWTRAGPSCPRWMHRETLDTFIPPPPGREEGGVGDLLPGSHLFGDFGQRAEREPPAGSHLFGPPPGEAERVPVPPTAWQRRRSRGRGRARRQPKRPPPASSPPPPP